MPIQSTLAKAEADLRAGRTPVARQRLRSLVNSCPTELVARRRLAEVYRLYGEPSQAGRWNYLEEDADPAETAAFEARYPDPLDRMAALAWRGHERHAATEHARARLAALRETAGDRLGRPVHWHELDAARPSDTSSHDDGTAGCVLLVVAAVVVAFLAVVGAVTAVGWML
ncbi:DUF6584 family protein [Kitasatospora sp. NPDC049285]|uniref:DUF6584 family protein n=1 Tax=Kitasatospora sp. NPDC049285 TaxID=3157096 RepID=UPI00341B80F7